MDYLLGAHHPPEQTRDVATLGINALLAARLITTLLQSADNHTNDQRYLSEWTATLTGRIRELTQHGPIDN